MKSLNALTQLVSYSTGFIITICCLSSQLYSQKAGSIDSTFGNNGIVYCESPYSLYYPISILDAQGRILTISIIDDGYSYLLVRNLPDGSLDTAFGDNGQVTQQIESGYYDYNFSLLLQSENKILVAGSSYDSADFYHALITRFLDDGTIDSTFGNQGLMRIENVLARRLALQEDGKLLVSGNIYFGGYPSILLLRLLPDGKIDSTFGVAGKVITNLNTLYTFYKGELIVLQPDGKIIIVAKNYDLYGYERVSAILRYKSNGTPDTSFGINGVSIDSSYIHFYDIGLQEDLSILLAGGSCGWGCSLILSQYTYEGLLDSSFGVNGQYASFWGMLMDLEIQSDHKILTAGSWSDSLLLMRFTPQGQPDTTFASQGKSLTKLDDLLYSGNKIHLYPDGKITVLGTATNQNNNKSKVFIARYFNDLGTAIPNVPRARQFNVQVYPNPAMNSMYIEFTLDENSMVDCILYDLNGRAVQTLFDKNLNTGFHRLEMNIDIPDGFYFLKLSSEHKQIFKKIAVMH